MNTLKYNTTLDNIKVLESQHRDKLNNIEQIENNIKQIEGTKKEKILELKDILLESGEFSKPEIKDKITKDLDGIVSAVYISEVLGREFNKTDTLDKKALREKAQQEERELILTDGKTEKQPDIINIQSKNDIKSVEPNDLIEINQKLVNENAELITQLVENNAENEYNEIEELRAENQRLKQEIQKLKTENEKLRAELENKPKPVQQTAVNPLFSSKTNHGDYFKNKYQLKKK